MKDPDPCNAKRSWRRAHASRDDTWYCGYRRGHDGPIHASLRADGSPQRRWPFGDGMDSYGPCKVDLTDPPASEQTSPEQAELMALQQRYLNDPLFHALVHLFDRAEGSEPTLEGAQSVQKLLDAIEALGYAVVPAEAALSPVGAR